MTARRALAALLLLALAAPAQAKAPADPEPGATARAEALATFRAAPVGQRLAALMNEPIMAVPLAGDEVAVVVYAPEQGSLSRWDDESRVVLYRRAKPDWERVQFVSKAGESIPGRLRALLPQDVDGDGLVDLVALGGPHGPVGKATLMVFRRWEAGGKFYAVFRRRQAAPALTFGPGGKLAYTYEAPTGGRRFEAFALDGNGHYQPADGQARAFVVD